MFFPQKTKKKKLFICINNLINLDKTYEVFT